MAWVVFRNGRPLVAWLATASLIGVVGEGILGGVVVANELQSWLVVVHLGLAMMIIGFLIATAVMAGPPPAGGGGPFPPPPGPPDPGGPLRIVLPGSPGAGRQPRPGRPRRAAFWRRPPPP